MRKAVIIDTSEESPWAAFKEQQSVLEGERLIELFERWRETAISGQSLGDAMIVGVANLYSKYRIPVEILTGDKDLKSYEHKLTSGTEAYIPRRRR